MIKQLDSETADLNLTSAVTCLTHTPSATVPVLCQAEVNLGDGTKNLTGAGGSFELTVSIGGQTLQPGPKTITFGTAVRATVRSEVFTVPANAEVIVQMKSPNAGDSDVTVNARLFDLSPAVLGTDYQSLISTDAQDLSGTLSVDVGAIATDTDAAVSLAAAIDTTNNLVFADVQAVHASGDAAASLEIAAARLGNKAIQNIATGTITVRNVADDADLYTVTITNDSTDITREIS